ncbi:MAG: spermidine synthase, partial [Gammaproteobacteria bacterium]|nr:spermidine synthase [Gammaproteobacteria bacterium]
HGDGLALREVLKYKKVESITLVDLDPEIIKLASENKYMRKLNKDAFNDARIVVQEPAGIKSVNVKGVYLSNGELDDKGQVKSEWVASVNVYSLDADQFVNTLHHQKWDAVIIDFPDPSSVELSKLYSKQFYRKLKRHLSENAFIAIQSTSPYHAKEAFLTIGNTLNAAGYSVLPYRQNIPSFGDWGYYLAWSTEKSPQDIKEKLAILTKFSVETDFITPELMMASFAFGKGELSSTTQCVNTIMHPCLLTQYTDYSWQLD